MHNLAYYVLGVMKQETSDISVTIKTVRPKSETSFSLKVAKVTSGEVEGHEDE